MRCHRSLIALGQCGDLARFREAAAPADIEHDHVGRLRLQNVAERCYAAQRLACAYRNPGGARVLRKRRDVAHLDRILRPERTVLLERACNALGLIEIPQRMEFGHDLDAIAYRFADLAKRCEPDLQILCG